MLIYFPQMHEELVSEKVEGAVLFDPGIDREQEGEISVFRPEDLPVESATCRRMVEDFISYGESLGDMFKMIVNPMSADKDQFGERTSAIQNALLASLNPVTENKMDEATRQQNQVVLALVYAYEARHLELKGLEESLGEKWSGFGESLGLDVDDEDERSAMALGGLMAHQLGAGGADVLLPWQKVLEGFAVLLPENSMLVTSDVEAVSYWRDRDLEFYEKEGILADKALVLREKCWKLLGMSSLPEEKPWLDREFTIVVTAE